MDDFDLGENDESLEALRKILRDLGLPDDADVMDSEVRADLFRNMMARLMPSDGMSDEAVVWETVRQMARHWISSLGPDPYGSSRVARQITDAVRLAELWLSDATGLPPLPTTPVVWSRAEWIESTLPSWKAMLEPIIGILATAVNEATSQRMDDVDNEMLNIQAILHPLMSRAVSTMFGAHVGESIGRAATTTMTGTDMGLPLLSQPMVAILPTNLSAMQQQGDLDEEALLLYCALREVARQRLFLAVGWIAPQIIALVQHYAREMKVDPDAIGRAMDNAVPDHLSAETVAAFQTDFSSILFAPEHSEEQRAILDRLNTLLALVEGWVEDVTSTVAKQFFPGWEAISESLRRHRATSKPSHWMVTPLIGMGASPRTIREAAAFWEGIREAKGTEGRDEIWRYPDSMPTASDITDVEGFLSKPGPEDDPWDDELRKFLAADPE